MASIVKRGNKFCVVAYTDGNDGKRHQKWESFATYADAKNRKQEVGSLKLEAGHCFIQSKYKVCCNRLLAGSCWLLAESRKLEARSWKQDIV